MAQPFSSVQFVIQRTSVVVSTCSIERFEDDSLSHLLQRLSEKSNIKAEDFSFVYQGEIAKMEGGELCYFAETMRGETKVLASQDRVEEIEHIVPDIVLSTNCHVSELDDVFCLPGLTPVVTIDLGLAFFEMDGSDAGDGSARALDDRQVVAWIEAFRLFGVRGEAAPIILLHSDTRCVDVRSGEVFQSCTDFLIASRTPVEEAKVQDGAILLRDGSRLPKWPIAPDLRTHIALRDGVDFCIEDGLIQVRQSSRDAASKRWVYPKVEPYIRVPADSKHHALKQQIMDYISS